MTKQELIDAGYNRFEPAPIDNECITDLFQKCVTDDVGKKYFINVKRWDFSIHGQRNDPIGYETEVQFRHISNGEYTDIVCLDGWSIKDTEKYFADLWNTGMFRYYEKWEYDDDKETAEEEETTSDEE